MADVRLPSWLAFSSRVIRETRSAARSSNDRVVSWYGRRVSGSAWGAGRGMATQPTAKTAAAATDNTRFPIRAFFCICVPPFLMVSWFFLGIVLNTYTGSL